jgi:putative copper export protein
VEAGLDYAWAGKSLVYCLGQLAVGVIVFRQLMPRDDIHAWLGRLALVVSCLLVVALLLRAWAQTATAFGVTEAWLPENLRLIAFESRWGAGWRLQMLAALAMLGATLAMTKQRTAAWVAFALSTVGLAVAMPLLGHAAGSALRHVVHVLHNLGAGTWLGTLGVMTLYAWRLRASAEDVPAFAALVDRFSPLALCAAALVGASGLTVAWLYVGSFEAMWTTAYGRVLSLKLGTVALVGLMGFTNWRGVRRGSEPRRAVMTAEWIAALLVVSITGLLTEMEHP